MKHARKLIFSSLFFIAVFFSGNSAWPAPIISELKIPIEYGIKKEDFISTNANNSKPAIIYIQDAHCNYEAQKNMVQILDYLVKEHHLKLIMVEGGTGNVGLSFLREFADKKSREEVADKYLKQGKISGEEYLDITSDYDLELYGIEDEDSYDTHLAAFFKVDSLKEESLRYLGSVSNAVASLKSHIYSPELRELEEKKNNYEAKTLSLLDYCQYLKTIAEKKGLDSQDYSHISAFSETAFLEKEIDFKQAETERNAFIKELAGFLEENVLKELVNKSQDFKANKLTPQEYYAYLKEISGQKLDLAKNYPHLNSYIRYLTVSKEVDAAELLKEVAGIEEKVKEACFITTDQRRLNETAKSVNILTQLLNLELIPEDYAYFKVNRSKFMTTAWVNFINENCAKYNLGASFSASPLIDDNLFKLNEFYQLGTDREGAFIKNINNKLNASKEKIAVLITGGFHTPGMAQFLKDSGYSYAVVTPAITQKGDSNIYLSVLRGEGKAAEDEVIDLSDEEESEE